MKGIQFSRLCHSGIATVAFLLIGCIVMFSGCGGGGSSGTPTYAITYVADPAGAGTFGGAKPASAKADATVGFTVTATSGSVLESVSWKTATGTATPLTGGTGGAYSFTMPKAAVTVTAKFETLSANERAITYVADPVAGGTLNGPVKAEINTSVSFTVTANSGYSVESVSWKTATGTPTTLTAGAGGAYSFTMPSDAVTVTAKFLSGTNPNPVTSLDLTNLLTAPVHRAIPVVEFENTQYTGTAAWYYTDAPTTPLTGKFDSGKEIGADVTLIAKSPYVFDGVGANTFTHSGAKAISNAVNSGTVTVTFDPAAWAPNIISYPRLGAGGYEATIKATSWPGVETNPPRGPAQLINLADPAIQIPSSFWDYGYNSGTYGATNGNSSSWPDIMNGPGITFNGDETGQGHHNVFLNNSESNAPNRRAHAFTIDLGEIKDDIVSLGMYPRDATASNSDTNTNKRWPVRFEVFYSDDDIDPIFSDNTPTSLGIVQADVSGSGGSATVTPSEDWGPKTNTWQDVALYKRTTDGKGFSARYLHIRIYANQGDPQDDTWWIQPSFAQIRIGINEENAASVNVAIKTDVDFKGFPAPFPVLSKNGDVQSVTISVADHNDVKYTDVRWFIDDAPAPSSNVGGDLTLTLDAASLTLGGHTLAVVVKVDGLLYSKEVPFQVTR